MDFQEALRRHSRQLGVSLARNEEEQLETYLRTLRHWNRVVNLTAWQGEVLIRRLIVEPLWVAAQLRPAGRYLDVGSGNGSPAIPWHVRCQFAAVELVEAHHRKAIFLEQVARQMGLKRVTVHPVRIEALSGLEPVDWLSLQGVRLTRALYDRLRPLAPLGRIVWITKPADSPIVADQMLEIPESDRCVLVFR